MILIVCGILCIIGGLLAAWLCNSGEVAFIFFMVAVAGFFLTYSEIRHISEKNKSQEIIPLALEKVWTHSKDGVWKASGDYFMNCSDMRLYVGRGSTRKSYKHGVEVVCYKIWNGENNEEVDNVSDGK